MGNSLESGGGEPRHPELSALNKAEEKSLTILYGRLFLDGSDGQADLAKVSGVFGSNCVPDFANAVVRYMHENTVSSLVAFQVMMAKCSRGRADDTIQFFWNLCSLCDHSNDTQAVIFFKIILEFGKCIEEGIDGAAKALYAHLVSTSNNKESTATSFETLIEWSHEYAPNMQRLLVTYLNQVCYSDVELLSFVPFCPPVLEVASNIISQSVLLPLSLYTTKCQGKWKCLYTTARDGISFNRIAHNILGYGVSCR